MLNTSCDQCSPGLPAWLHPEIRPWWLFIASSTVVVLGLVIAILSSTVWWCWSFVRRKALKVKGEALAAPVLPAEK